MKQDAYVSDADGQQLSNPEWWPEDVQQLLFYLSLDHPLPPCGLWIMSSHWAMSTLNLTPLADL